MILFLSDLIWEFQLSDRVLLLLPPKPHSFQNLAKNKPAEQLHCNVMEFKFSVFTHAARIKTREHSVVVGLKAFYKMAIPWP